MADVRLTATNPQDSSVVPVACNEKGELKLEEPIQGPPGQTGEQGPPGPKGEDGADGDPFTGNFADDVTFGGSASFAGGIELAANGSASFGGSTLALNGSRTIEILSGGSAGIRISNLNTTGADGAWINFWDLSRDSNAGQCSFGAVRNDFSFVNSPDGAAQVSRETARLTNAGKFLIGGTLPASPNIALNANGSVTFAGGKSGFTAEGYLWCTTERGDTVMLEATVGGAGMWKAYTPPREAIKDKLESIVDIDNPRQTRD